MHDLPGEDQIAAAERRLAEWRARGENRPADASALLTEALDGVADLLRQWRQGAAADPGAAGQEEGRLGAILQSIGDAIIATDREGRVTLMNGAAGALTGWTEAEALGRPLPEVFCIADEVSGAVCTSPVRLVLQTGQAQALTNHTLLTARDGTKRAISESGAPLVGSDGEVQGVVLVFRDVTAERQTRAELARLASFPEVNPNLVLEISARGELLYANAAVRKVLAEDREALLAPLRAGWDQAPVVAGPAGPGPLSLEIPVGERWYLAACVRMPGQARMRVYMIDITAHKAAEEARHLEHERLSTTLMSIGDAVIATDRAGQVTLMNGVAEQLTGWSEAEARGRALAEVFPIHNEMTGAVCANPVELVLRSGLVQGLANHTVLTARDGSLRAIADSGAPILTSDGRVEGVVLVFRDVTESSQLERERQAALELLELVNLGYELPQLMEEMTAFLQYWSGCEAIGIRLRAGDDFPYFETRGFGEEFFTAESTLCSRDAEGHAPQDANGTVLLDCMCGNILQGRFDPALPFFTARGSFWTNSTTELLAGTTERERQSPTRNRCNTAGYESVALIPLRSGTETLGLLQFNDRHRGRFTPERIALLERLSDSLAPAVASRLADAELQARERELREAQGLLQGLLDSTPSLVYIKDLEGRWLLVNQEMARLLGRPQEELLGRTTHELFPAEVADVHRANDLAVIESGMPITVEEVSGETAGNRIYISVKFPLFDASGQVRAVCGLSTDITELRAAEAALAATNERYRSLYQAVSGGIVLLDLNAEVVDANEAAAELLGIPLEELLGETVAHPDWNPIDEDGNVIPREERPVMVVLREKRPVRGWVFRVPPALAPRDRWLLMNCEPLLDPQTQDLQGVVCILVDVTEQREIREELRRHRDELEQLVAERTARLAESEAKYRELVTKATSIIVRLDQEGRIVFFSEWAERVSGYGAEEVVGQSAFGLLLPLDPDLQGDAAEGWRRLQEQLGDERQREIRWHTKAGADLWILWNATPLYDEQGEFSGVLGVGQDVTEKHQALEALQRRDQVLAAIALAAEKFLAEADWTKNIPEVLKRLGEATGASRVALTQNWTEEAGVVWARHVHQWAEPDHPHTAGLAAESVDFVWTGPGLRSWAERLARGERVLCATSDAERVWLETHGLRSLVLAPVRLEGAWWGTLAFDDCRGERGWSEAELETLAAAADILGVAILRQRNKERLQRTIDELARSNEELEQFAYVASHDLQEPLRTVTSYVQLLEQEYADQLGGEGEEYLEFVIEATGRMHHLIQDLLAYSRASAVRQSLRPVASEVAVRQATADLRQVMEATGAHLEYGELPEVQADLAQLTRLFQNLLSNALKFHGEAPPEIFIEAERSGHDWLFRVRDNGIGISAAFIDRIFVIFQRLHTREEYTGTGVGLAICKKIVERHGGRLWVESEPGSGTTFFFTLPAGAAPGEARHQTRG
ncbi:MAG TPA: PAS domain-containing protein [Armatimonadota bacterium]|jgi:PAS domain S-box-containing protein